jgi:leader peptidase (prepilin peptidase) / N-methyltransferase
MNLFNFFIPIFGFIVGSFLNVCIYRLPRNKSIILLNSFCPSCEKPIKLYDNIPILSYLILKGKCRQCGAHISIRYPMVEFITAFLFFLLLKKYGLSFEFFVRIIFISLLVVIAFIDLDFRIIPDILSIGGLIAGFVLAFLRKPLFFWQDAFYGILISGGVLSAISFVYWFFTKKEGIGSGDIKLICMIGAFCGLKGAIFSLLAGSFLGVLIGVPLMLVKGEDVKYAIPFGPLLSLSTLIFMFFGDRFIHGFLSLYR